MNRSRFLVLAGMILVAAVSRLIPHPPNFTPIGALALFGGAQFADKRLAFFVPLSAMFLSDLVIGLHGMMPIIYGCFALIVCLGLWIRCRQSTGNILVATMVASLLFFIVTNFAVWAGSSMYPKTAAGLMTCYVAAIPFLWNMLAGHLVYGVILFGGLRTAEWQFPHIRESTA